jgi:hypothetical protein
LSLLEFSKRPENIRRRFSSIFTTVSMYDVSLSIYDIWDFYSGEGLYCGLPRCGPCRVASSYQKFRETCSHNFQSKWSKQQYSPIYFGTLLTTCPTSQCHNTADHSRNAEGFNCLKQSEWPEVKSERKTANMIA